MFFKYFQEVSFNEEDYYWPYIVQRVDDGDGSEWSGPQKTDESD